MINKKTWIGLHCYNVILDRLFMLYDDCCVGCWFCSTILQVASVQMWEIGLCVYARRVHMGRITAVETASKATGFVIFEKIFFLLNIAVCQVLLELQAIKVLLVLHLLCTIRFDSKQQQKNLAPKFLKTFSFLFRLFVLLLLIWLHELIAND